VTITNQEVIDEFKEAQARVQGGGSQLGGGAAEADLDSAGGSSGTGGYGNGQNQANHQGQDPGPDANPEKPVTRELSRGERYDLAQGGGRADDAVDFGRDLTQDERDRQERGQRFIDGQGGVTEGQQP